MINLIFRSVGDVIAGTVDGKPFNVANTDAHIEQLEAFREDANTQTKDVMLWVKASYKQEIAGSNKYLLHNPVTGEYFLTFEDYRSDKAIPKVLVDYIEDSYDKNIDFMPVIKAWARFLKNPRYTPIKAEYFAAYLATLYTDRKEAQRLIEEENFESDVASNIATYQDISITQEGLLATYKVARMVTWEFQMVWDEDAQEHVKKRNPKYKPIPAKIDPTTGETLEESSFEKPDFLEDYLFTPAIYTSGDKFYSGAQLGYVYQVGEIQRLPRNAKRNLSNSFGGGGLYIGGLNYIEAYRSDDRKVLTCFVDPGDIISFQSEGHAIRVDALMPNNVWDEEVPLKGMYHSSDYGKISGERLDSLIKDAVDRDVDLIEEQVGINAAREAGQELEADE